MPTEGHKHGCRQRSVHDAEVIRDTMRDPTLCQAHDWHTVPLRVAIGHTATDGIKDHKLTDYDRIKLVVRHCNDAVVSYR
jgi:hypothetical protein